MPSPQFSGNVEQPAGNPNTLYNNLASNGMPPDNSQQSTDEAGEQKDSPADIAIKRFQTAFDTFDSLSKDYPQSSELADGIKKQMGKWLTAIVAAQSNQGGELSPL